MALGIRTVRETAEALPEAGAELHAWALTAKRHARADAEHGAREFQYEHTRPVHVHLAKQDALNLRDPRARCHAVLPDNAIEDVRTDREQCKPDRNPENVVRQPAVENGQSLFG